MRRSTAQVFAALILVAVVAGAGAAGTSAGGTGPQPLVSSVFALSSPTSGANLSSPAIAFDGTNYLVAWSDYRVGGWDLLGVRVSSEGTVLAPGEFTIAGGAGSQEYPDVAWDGQNYLVVWGDSRPSVERVQGAFVTTAGAVLSRFPISGTMIAPLPSPSVSFNGSNYLVAWSQGEFSQFDLYANRVSPAGFRLDGTGFAVSATNVIEREASVATNGSDFLVAWQEQYDTGVYMPYAARVSGGGVVLDPQGLPLDLSPGDALGPSAAFDGARYLVVWSEYDARDIVGSRVRPSDGLVLDPQGFTISAASTDESGAVASWDGGVFETVWNESADSSAPQDVRGARVTGDATVLDPSGFDVSRLPDREFSLDAAAGTLGRTAVTNIQSPNVDGPRHVALRFLDRGPVPSTGIAQPGDWFAFLHGHVNPNTQRTNVWFEWGPTEALGNATPVQVMEAPGNVRADIYNLESDTSYYFRVVAENASGRGHGETKRFGTLTVLPPPIPPPPQPPPGPPPPSQVPPPVPRCRVPAVVGRSYRVARTRILRARCRVGRVRRARSRRRAGLVISQRPRAGARFRPGTRVNLVVSRGRR